MAIRALDQHLRQIVRAIPWCHPAIFLFLQIGQVLLQEYLRRHGLISNLISKLYILLQFLGMMLKLKTEILVRYLLISSLIHMDQLPTLSAHFCQTRLYLLKVNPLVLVRRLWVAFRQFKAVILVNHILPLLLVRHSLSHLLIYLILLLLQLFLKLFYHSILFNLPQTHLFQDLLR